MAVSQHRPVVITGHSSKQMDITDIWNQLKVQPRGRS